MSDVRPERLAAAELRRAGGGARGGLEADAVALEPDARLGPVDRQVDERVARLELAVRLVRLEREVDRRLPAVLVLVAQRDRRLDQGAPAVRVVDEDLRIAEVGGDLLAGAEVAQRRHRHLEHRRLLVDGDLERLGSREAAERVARAAAGGALLGLVELLLAALRGGLAALGHLAQPLVASRREAAIALRRPLLDLDLGMLAARRTIGRRGRGRGRGALVGGHGKLGHQHGGRRDGQRESRQQPSAQQSMHGASPPSLGLVRALPHRHPGGRRNPKHTREDDRRTEP